MNPKHGAILVVDDHDEIRDSVAKFLTLNGFDVETAQNGTEGLAKTRSHRPCVVVLDLMMPVMSGFEFRERQLEDELIREIPVIVLTAQTLTLEERASLTTKDVLLKPVDPDQLLHVLRRYCS